MNTDQSAGSQFPLSPDNMKLWNGAGLVMSNGTVTMSVPALDLLLTKARQQGEAKVTYLPKIRVAELCFGFGWSAGYEAAWMKTDMTMPRAWADSPAQALAELTEAESADAPKASPRQVEEAKSRDEPPPPGDGVEGNRSARDLAQQPEPLPLPETPRHADKSEGGAS